MLPLSDFVTNTMSTYQQKTVNIRPADAPSISNLTVVGKYRREFKSAVINSDHFYPTPYSVCTSRGSGFETWQSRFSNYSYEYVTTYNRHYGLRQPSVKLGGGYIAEAETPGVIFKSNPALNNRLLEAVKNQKVDIGATLAELPETVSYLADSAKALIKFASFIRTGRLNKAASQLLGKDRKKALLARKGALKSAASRWLEFNFAIKPLVSDISTFTELYRDPISVMTAFSCRARAKTEHIFTEDSVDGPLFNAGYTQGKTSHACAVQDRLCFVYSVANPEKIAAKALGLENPPAALWEGIPFSWLLDYAINLGEFLSLLTAVTGLTLKHGYRSIRGKYLAVGSYFLNRVIGYNTQQGSISYNYQRDFYSRRVETAWPDPEIRYVLPEISGQKVSYVLSLLTLMLKGK